MIPTMKVESMFKVAAVFLVACCAIILYSKGCARKGSEINQQIQKETISVQRQSIEISANTIERVTNEQSSVQAKSDSAVRTILGGKGRAVPPSADAGKAAGHSASDAPKRPDGGDLASPAVDDDCDYDCIMRVAWEAKDAATRAACQLRGKGSCDHPGRPSGKP